MKRRAAALLITDSRGVGRRFWYPYYPALAGGRTHDQVVRDLGAHAAARAEANGVSGVQYTGAIALLE